MVRATEQTSGSAPGPASPPRQLVDLRVAGDAQRQLLHLATQLPGIQLSARSLCDLHLLAVGALSPLDRFLGQADYQSVLETMRLQNGQLCPLPLTLPVASSELAGVSDRLVLRDARNRPIALLQLTETFAWDAHEEARHVLGTTDPRHPLVAEMSRWCDTCITGKLTVLDLPRAYDFVELRRTPAQVRRRLDEQGRSRVLAFQTCDPLNRPSEELTRQMAADLDASLLLQLVVGLARIEDIDHYTRVRICRTLVERYYDPRQTLLNLLPLAPRQAGPRSALWHALIQRNYGATHLLIGPSHTTPGSDSEGQPFYLSNTTQTLLEAHATELGITPVPFAEPGPPPQGRRPGADQPSQRWFLRKEAASILAQVNPPRHQQGFCVWFTGLSGSGKSTIAEVLTVKLLERGKQLTLLDGDVVRTHLSKGLGFSRADRDDNILRIGFVAGEVVRHRGAVICAAVSPYRAARSEVRKLIGDDCFIEVFVDTPLEVCEARDTKGLYARARRGAISGFTGIDDPYEPPLTPELVLQTVSVSPEANADMILAHLQERGFLRRWPDDPARQPPT